MDHFGIGAAMQAMARMYSQTARRTGRTTALVASLQPGDRVVCATDAEARTLQRIIKERGLAVDVICIPPTQAHSLIERGRSTGRTLFDHTWVEMYYAASLRDASCRLDRIQECASDHQAQYFESEFADGQRAKWR